MRKIPPGAEGSIVLVGETNFLSKHINAFIRLEDAQNLGDIMEVPIPIRFIFLMLGPSGQEGRYHEIGRSIATLMSDEVSYLSRKSLNYLYTDYYGNSRSAVTNIVYNLVPRAFVPCHLRQRIIWK